MRLRNGTVATVIIFFTSFLSLSWYTAWQNGKGKRQCTIFLKNVTVYYSVDGGYYVNSSHGTAMKRCMSLFWKAGQGDFICSRLYFSPSKPTSHASHQASAKSKRVTSPFWSIHPSGTSDNSSLCVSSSNFGLPCVSTGSTRQAKLTRHGERIGR